MPNLHGVDLQRAIAERKGWTKVHHRDTDLVQDYPGSRCLTQVPSGLWGTPPGKKKRPIMLPWWHSYAGVAHALLGELVGKSDGDPVVIVINCDGSVSMTFGTVEVDADGPDAFCVCAGNLYLECGE